MATAIPHSDIAQWLRTGQAAQRAGDDRHARACFERALALDPAHPVTLNALGMACLRAGDPAAVGFFERAVAADAGAGAIWLNLAAAWRAQGGIDGERDALERALARDQRNVMANVRLAELLDRIGEAEAAFPRWQGLVTMLAGSEDLPAELHRVLATAQTRVAAHRADLAARLDAALAAPRGRLDGRERRRFDAAVDTMLGRRRIFLNVCHGLHFPFLPADEFFDPALFDWMPALRAATPAITQELQALMAAPGFAPYVAMDPGSPDNKWTTLDRSMQWNARYLWRYGVRDEDVCARCPRTDVVLAGIPRVDLPGQAPTAFFSVLQPGTHLPPHTGVSNIRSIVHLPLIVPEGCAIRVGAETHIVRTGEPFAFDDTIEHEAWNRADTLRAVLIFDVWNPHLTLAERTLLSTMFGAMPDAGGVSRIAD